MSVCQQCSIQLADDAPRGMCPACLLATGIGISLIVDGDRETPDLGDRYWLGEVLGEGGFGTVYRAQQLEPLQREVAVKILKPGMASGQVLARFEAERQALALMDHPNIARILDAGEAPDGRPYFVMELVDGVPITDHCRVQGLSIAERLTLFQKVTEAVAHAHQKGVIHRDLKPSNLLVASAGEPTVIDFGVAKALAEPLTDRTLYTKIYQAIGTPAYMSPEQCGGRADEVDTRSDVYALGAVLYELLTGQAPFVLDENMSYAQVLETIRERSPAAPSGVEATVPRELDWVCARAMAKEPERRYGGAGELGRDLGRFLADETLTAGPPSRVYALRKLVARNRALFVMGMVALLALVGGIIGSLLMFLDAEEARENLQRSYVQRDLNDAINAARSARAGDAVAHYCHALRLDPGNQLATSQLLGLLMNHRWVRPMAAPVELPESIEPIFIAVGERRAWILATGGELLSVGVGGVKLLDKVAGAQGLVAHGDRYTVIGRQSVGTVEFDSPITAWDQVPDASAPAVLVGCEDGGVHAVDLETGAKRTGFPVSQAVVSIAAAESLSAPFALATRDAVYAGSWGEKKPLRLWKPGDGLPVHGLKMLVPGSQVAAAAGDGAGVFAVGGQRKIESLGPLGRVTGGFDFVTAGRLLLTGCGDGCPRLWQLDLEAGTADFVLDAGQHRGEVTAVHFLRGGDSALSLGAEGVARVWDVDTGRGEPLRAGGRIDEFSISMDKRVAVSYDRGAATATRWALDRRSALSPRVDWLDGFERTEGGGRDLSEFTSLPVAGDLDTAAISPSGERIVTCVDGRTLQLWREADGIELCPRWSVARGVEALVFRGEEVVQLSYRGGKVCEVALPPAAGQLDEAFLDFAEAFVCRRSRADGSLETVPAQPLQELERSGIHSDGGRAFADWLVADDDDRLLWPGAQRSIKSYGEKIMALGLEGEREAARLGISGARERLKTRVR